MKICFTLCSNNYYAQAKTLADSFTNHNPNYLFFIIIVDKPLDENGYGITTQKNIRILPISDVIDYKILSSLINKYNIIELNTSVKASCFKYFIKNYSASEIIFYLDPDIMVFNSFIDLEKKLHEYNILLTPHLVTPSIKYNNNNLEKSLLGVGVYNLGFIGINNNSESDNFIDWWEDRLFKVGYIDPINHYFVDQKWADFVPSYFNKVYIIRELGYNMAPWNIHERYITEYSNKNITINNEFKLYFFHFSKYYYKNKDVISDGYGGATTLTRPDLKELYEAYYNQLISNNIEYYSKLKCQLRFQSKKSIKYRLLLKIINAFEVKHKMYD